MDKIEVKVYYKAKHFPELGNRIREVFEKLGMEQWAQGTAIEEQISDMAFDWPVDALLADTQEQGTPHPNYECEWDGCWCHAEGALDGYIEEQEEFCPACDAGVGPCNGPHNGSEMTERIGKRGWRIWEEKSLHQEVVPLCDAEGVAARLEEENDAPKRYEHDTDGLSCWCRPTPIGDNVWVHKKWSEFLGYVKQLEDTYGSVGFAKTCMQRDQNKAIHLKDENEALKQESERLNGVLDEINEVTQRTEIKVDALLENMRADTLEDK